MPTHRPPRSDLPIYLALFFGFGLSFTCLTGLLGGAVVYVLAVIAGVAAIAGVHYCLWGWWLGAGRNVTEEEKFPES